MAESFGRVTGEERRSAQRLLIEERAGMPCRDPVT
jgi:hypothetical protein